MASKLDTMGKKAYKSREWDDAIAAFEAAYEADPLPRFPYNLARCYEKKDAYGEAIEHLNRYLQAAPDAEDKGETVARIKLLEVKLKKSSGDPLPRWLRPSSWRRLNRRRNRRGARGGFGTMASTSVTGSRLPGCAVGVRRRRLLPGRV